MTLAPSDWEVRQYTRIDSILTWSLDCSVCGHADGTDSKKAALDIAREHLMRVHPELCMVGEEGTRRYPPLPPVHREDPGRVQR